jgi:hypothetical protein
MAVGGKIAAFFNVNTTFIYARLEPDKDEVRYVGKANDPEIRLVRHMTYALTHVDHASRWLNSLRARGQKPRIEIIAEVPVEEWQFWERHFIKQFRDAGFDLTNSTAGGDGVHAPSPEVRGKMRRGRLGKKWTEEQRAARQRAFQESPPNLGRVFDKEARANMAKGHLGKKLSNNKSGHVGVCWIEAVQKYKSQICVNTKRIGLGHFKKLEDAIFVRALGWAVYGQER